MTEDFAVAVPKAELHVHLEGTLEPEMMFELARRNDVALLYANVEEVRGAYDFGDLQSFLDVYYRSCAVLRTERDFYELTFAYLRRAAQQGVVHAEVFFDPQTHAANGVPLATVLRGISGALDDGRSAFGISSGVILCFLRHLPAPEAIRTLREALDFGDLLAGVGLDSSELGHPPRDFEAVFAMARAEGFRAVVHAGEEGPPEYIWQALNLLGAERIDHGVRCLEDEELVRYLALRQVPLTVCPLSNLKLRVVGTLAEHPLATLLERHLMASVHSDDPAYFDGYIADNYRAVARALALDDSTVARLAANSLRASWLDEPAKAAHLTSLHAMLDARTGTDVAGPSIADGRPRWVANDDGTAPLRPGTAPPRR